MQPGFKSMPGRCNQLPGVQEHLSDLRMEADNRTFKAKARAENAKRQVCVDLVLQEPPYSLPAPRKRPPEDNRFEYRKNSRVYACDGCGNLVPFSSWSRDTGSRSRGEFQGSYVDHSWARSMPPSVTERGHLAGLINCTWYCTQVCGAKPTGVKNRTLRPAIWRAAVKRKHQAR